MSTISPQEFLERQRAGEALWLIDVRTPAEFDALHAEGAESIPLDRLDPRQLLDAQAGRAIYLICKSGARAKKALAALESAGATRVGLVEGGIDAWQAAGLPVVRGTSRVISLERQVRIAAGGLVLVGVVLGWFVHPGFYGVSAFVGAGLMFSGITDTCGMAMVLARLPWNRRRCSQGCAVQAEGKHSGA
jgi:rhodanese-related sulfurtransferase